MAIETRTPHGRALYYQHYVTNFSKPGISTLRRHWEYLKNPSHAQLRNTASAITSIVAGGYLGYKLGVETSNCMCNENKGYFSNPKVIALTPPLFAGLGILSGSYAGLRAYMKAIEMTNNYKAWKMYHLSDATKDAIYFVYSEDEVLAQFKCLISDCVMENPVRVPSGQVYDFAQIMNSPREDDGKIKDPMRNQSFSEDQMIPDLESALVIHKRLRHLLRSDLNAVQNMPELSGPIEAYLRELDISVREHYNEAKLFILERRSHGEIVEFERLFGANADMDLDWTEDWDRALKIRFSLFYPNAVILGM